MSDIIAVVTPDEELKVEVSEGVLTLSSTVLNNPTTVYFLSDIGNVDNTNLQNESLLVYKTATGKWTSVNVLNSPTFVNPTLGTPFSGNLVNCTFPILNQDTTGNAATVTNGVYTTGSYSDPTWLAISKSKVGLGNVDNESKATMFTSPTFTGTPLAPTAGPTTNTTQIATTEFVKTAVGNLINSAPAALDTLNELAAALGNDANFATTVTNSLALKAPLANPAFTGTVSGITKAMVGLGNVDNTADANKNVLFATTSGNVTGVVAVLNGGTGATTLTGYVKGTGTTAMTASATIPVADINATGTPSSTTYLRGDSTWSSIPAQVYPSAGIARSTGSAWGTSYNVTGSNDVVLNYGPSISYAYLNTYTNIFGTLNVGADPANFDSAGLFVNIGAGHSNSAKTINIGTGGSSTGSQVTIGQGDGYYYGGISSTELTLNSSSMYVNNAYGIQFVTGVGGVVGNGVSFSGGPVYINTNGESGPIYIGSGNAGESNISSTSIRGETTFFGGDGSTISVQCPATFTGAVNLNSVSAIGTNGTVTLAPTGTGTVDVSSKRITSVATPTQPTDAVNKAYVDNVAENLHIHEAANCATTNTLAILSGGTVTYNNGTLGVGATLTLSVGLSTIDGFTLTSTSRILVKNEVNQAHNGIYVRTSATVLTRASDFDTALEIGGGDFIFVESGSTYASTGWVQAFEVLTVGTDTVIWRQFSGSGTFTAGAGLTLTGSTFDVVGTADRIIANADSIDIASTYVGQSTITTLGTIGTGTWQGTVIGATYGGTGVNNGAKTITLGGNFTHTGAHTLGLTTTANTSITLPTSGTLATLANTETLSNKTLDVCIIDGGTY